MQVGVKAFVEKAATLELAGLTVEHLSLHSEVGQHRQGDVPLIVLKRQSPEASARAPTTGPVSNTGSSGQPHEGSSHEPGSSGDGLEGKEGAQQDGGGMPAVVFLHMTGASKEVMLRRMLPYARSGYVTCAIDCRYHGERSVDDDGALDSGAYCKALVRAWQSKPASEDAPHERPFLYDNLWDISRLVDYLSSRPDVDPKRIGVTGISLGGMHTWLAAAADPRIAAGVALIGVQSFGYGVENNCWQGRVSSIPDAFMAAAKEEGKSAPDADTVRKVFSHITPGLLDRFDAPASLPLIAPRPFLILNGEEDPRCPIAGVRISMKSALDAYTRAGGPENIKLQAYPGVAHEATKEMDEATAEWFHRHLLQRSML
eukprot:jgi/Mesvir1/8789/Mv02697-RA.1